jgi:hypothetical protein
MGLTTTTAVQAILSAGGDYDTDASPDLQQFIDSADAVVATRLVATAAKKNYVHATAELEIIERWLAAHLYCCSDQPYKSRSTAGASGQFSGNTADGFDSTKYGQMACRLDYSGCLQNLNKFQRAGAQWLGKPPSAQIPYDERD